MAIRHKAVKDTLEVGTHSEWNEDHHYDPTLEFAEDETITFTSLVDRWDNGQCAAGGAITAGMVGAAGSGHLFITLTSGAGAGAIASMRGMVIGAASNITSPADSPVFTIAVDFDTIAATGIPAELGLFANATVPFTANQDGAYFRIDTNKLYAVTGDGAAETTTDLGAFSQFHVLRIELTATECRFYVDDLEVVKASHDANLPDTDLNVKLSTQVTDATSNIMRTDFIALRRLRKIS